MPKDFRTRQEIIFEELWTCIKEQPIPSCLWQFDLDWRDKSYRESRYFSFAAKCKGMTDNEYGDFLDKKMELERQQTNKK